MLAISRILRRLLRLSRLSLLKGVLITVKISGNIDVRDLDIFLTSLLGLLVLLLFRLPLALPLVIVSFFCFLICYCGVTSVASSAKAAGTAL